MLESDVVEEIPELMGAMDLPIVPAGTGEGKQYYSVETVDDIPLEAKYQLLEDMKETYEMLNKTVWFSERVVDFE